MNRPEEKAHAEMTRLTRPCRRRNALRKCSGNV